MAVRRRLSSLRVTAAVIGACPVPPHRWFDLHVDGLPAMLGRVPMSMLAILRPRGGAGAQRAIGNRGSCPMPSRQVGLSPPLTTPPSVVHDSGMAGSTTPLPMLNGPDGRADLLGQRPGYRAGIDLAAAYQIIVAFAPSTLVQRRDLSDRSRVGALCRSVSIGVTSACWPETVPRHLDGDRPGRADVHCLERAGP